MSDLWGFLNNIISYINPLDDNFLLKGVIDFLGNILSYINPFHENFLGKKIVELIGDLLKGLFIPSENSFNNLIDSVKSKFAFVDSIKIAIQSIQDMLEGVTSVPKLSIDMDSKYYKGNLVILDLSWYSQFKNYGDLIFTGFAYVLFFWRLWIHLPYILNGVGSVADNFISISRKGD